MASQYEIRGPDGRRVRGGVSGAGGSLRDDRDDDHRPEPYRSHAGGFNAYAQQSVGGMQAAEDRRKLLELERHVANLGDEPQVVATVVEVRTADDDKRMHVSIGPGQAVFIHALEGAKVGDRVLLTRNTMQATEILKDEGPQPGPVVTVDRFGNGIVESSVLGTSRAFRCPPGFKAQKGERVVVDASMTYVIGTLGMPPSDYGYTGAFSVSWNDIGGQEEAKAALRDAIELPLSHPALFKEYGKSASKGVLLSGPPGTGKTLLAKAAATAIARAHGKDIASGFVYVKGPELLGTFIGTTEAAIRAIFKAARDHQAKHGYPAVVFIDEADALLGARDRGQHTTINATVVPQFLAEMDGLDDAAAMLLLATNRPDMLDPAVVREGRIDRKVRVGRPTLADTRMILQIHLRNRPLLTDQGTLTKTKDGDAHWLAVKSAAEAAAAMLFADEHVVRDLGGGYALRARDFVSGSLISRGIVEQAATAAVLGDIAAGRARAAGISMDDLAGAIAQATRGLRDTDHREVMRELAEHGRIPA